MTTKPGTDTPTTQAFRSLVEHLHTTGQLTSKQRAVLILRSHDYSWALIAAGLHTTERTVRTHYRRGIAKILDRMEPA